MTRRIYSLCMLLLIAACTFVASAHAELVAIPPLQAHVTDLTQTLDEAQRTQLENKLAAFEQKKGGQIAVLIVPSTQPEDIAQYAIRVVEQWKLGREKEDDGVLLLVAKNDRKMRIEVGYGLEGAIPDVYAKRIISDIIAPHFKQGQYAAGIAAGVDQIVKLIDGEVLPAPQTQAEDKIAAMLPILLFGALISGLILRSIFGTFMGSALNGGLAGTVVWLLGLALTGAAMLGFVAFIFTLLFGSRGFNQYGGYPSGGSGWGGGSSGGWSGGGGGFGGGGASGDW